MLLRRVGQQPNEKRRYIIDYEPFLQTGETLSTVSTVVTETTGIESSPTLIVSSSSIELPSSQRAILFVSGGVDGAMYKIDVTVTTSLGQTREDELEFNITEV